MQWTAQRNSTKLLPITRQHIRKLLLLSLLLLILLPILSTAVPNGHDWRDTYQPAAMAVLQGRSPYSVEIYYAAPWAAWLLVPVAVLPSLWGRMLLFLISLAAYMLTAYRLGAKPLAILVFLGSSPVIGCLFNGNIEWMPLLGAVLPPQIGLILMAVKPQIGAGLGLYWLITIGREQGIRKVIKTFAPVSILLLISFRFYGFWPLRFSQAVAWNPHNSSLFPYGVGLGLILLLQALRTREPKTALASGPFLSPYVLLFTWAATLTALLHKPKVLALAVLILWIPVVAKLFLSG